MRTLAVLTIFGVSACAVDTTSGLPAAQPSGACSVVAVHSDFVSTSVSLLNGDGTLCVDGFVDSGSAALDVVAALSGDVVVPSTMDPEGRVVLVDRYPNAVVTLLDADGQREVEQLSVAMGYASNPQDVLFIGDGRAYVSRLASNPSPEPAASGLDAGGDLLIVDVALLEPTGRVALSADEGLDPMPSRMLPLGDRVWVLLNHLSRDFTRAGPGRIVGVDPATDAVVSTVTLEGLENCSAVTPDRGGEGLWVGCSGLFASGESAQVEASGLVLLGLVDGELAELWRVSASIDMGAPVAWSVTSVAPGEVAFTVFGSLAAGTPDRLMWAQRATERVEPLGVEAQAHELGGVLWSPTEELLLVADASPQEPLIRRFQLDAGAVTELDPVQGSPQTGLPPRHLRLFR